MRIPGSILQGILARAALTILRIYLGVALLVSAGLKLQDGYVARLAQPAPLIVWGELVIGTCLVLGLVTRLVAALAFLLSLNFIWMTGWDLWTETSVYPTWAALSLAVLIGAAGRTFGVDAFLAKRWPRSPFW